MADWMAGVWQTRSTTVICIAGAVTLWLAYLLVFTLTTGESTLAADMYDATINTLPAVGVGLVTYLILERFVLDRPLWQHLIVHPPLSLAFALGWYVLVLVSNQLIRTDWLTEGFSVRPFSYVAFVWQMFQGVTLYAVIACFTYAVHFRRRVSALEKRLAETQAKTQATPAEPRKPATSLLVRRDDEIVPVAFADIICITGAGDYAEVVTARGKTLSTTTLAEFETLLPEEQFVRVHRSHIVNIEAVTHAEPAGNGRLSLHLSDNSSLVASRAGARRFRETTV